MTDATLVPPRGTEGEIADWEIRVYDHEGETILLAAIRQCTFLSALNTAGQFMYKLQHGVSFEVHGWSSELYHELRISRKDENV